MNFLYIIVDVIGFKYLVISVICVKLEVLVEDLVVSLIDLLKVVLKDVGKSVNEIYDIIFVGG